MLVLPEFTPAGLLPPGVHSADWPEVLVRFGGTRRRLDLLGGLQRVATNLRDAGGRSLWLDGSFVTTKPEPGDFDGVWDLTQVDLTLVDPILIDLRDLRNGRMLQKAKYGGELFTGVEGGTGLAFQDFFQQTPNGDVKGIVLLNLRTLP